MPAGNYHDRVQLLVRSATTDDIGDDVEVFTPGRYYWARVEEQASRRASEFGGNQTGISGQIFLRNYITFDTLDMIRDVFGRVWKVEGSVWGANETILDVYTDDSLTDFVIEDS